MIPPIGLFNWNYGNFVCGCHLWLVSCEQILTCLWLVILISGFHWTLMWWNNFVRNWIYNWLRSILQWLYWSRLNMISLIVINFVIVCDHNDPSGLIIILIVGSCSVSTIRDTEGLVPNFWNKRKRPLNFHSTQTSTLCCITGIMITMTS